MYVKDMSIFIIVPLSFLSKPISALFENEKQY